MSAQHSGSGSADLEMGVGSLAQPPYSPSQLPAGFQSSPRPWKKSLHTCGHTHMVTYVCSCKCSLVLCRVFMPLLCLPLSFCPLLRPASSAQTSPTTSSSPWSGGSERRRQAGGHTWCTAGKLSSRSGRSPEGTFTTKVGRGQGPTLCLCSDLWGVFR